MLENSATILERFRRGRPGSGDIDLTLRPAYRDLLRKLGQPQNHLPPVFHVAGTNGKGSTCAFLRAILEAAGYRVHVYTSPHLINFHERIRIAGNLISEEELVTLLRECERMSEPGTLTYFEAATAVAFAAFAKHPADFTLLETGLGGRLDATNVVDAPLATIITRLSSDHREFLGNTLAEIAHEKAGIMRANIPCFVASQPHDESIETLQGHARAIGTALFIGDKDWRIEPRENGFHFTDSTHALDLPTPALQGAHQFRNAGLAIAALLGSKVKLPKDAFAKGVQTVQWPARLQRLETGALTRLMPANWALWLDGGHNDSAGEVLAEQAKKWREEDGENPRALHLITGMIKTKNPVEFLAPLAPFAASLHAVEIRHEEKSFSPDGFCVEARKAGIKNVAPSSSVQHAINEILKNSPQPARILICGSLYLAGEVLKENGE